MRPIKTCAPIGLLLLSAIGLAGQVSAPPPAQPSISWSRLVPNLVADQHRIWTFPARLAKGENWRPTAAVLATTAALIALDPTEGKFFRNSQHFQDFDNSVSGTSTAFTMAAVPTSTYLLGLWRGDGYMQHTALFAAEAVVDSEVVSTVIKEATYRQRPESTPPNGNFSDTWVENPALLRNAGGGFPSGHTIAAFSIATVIARRYGRHRWVPVAAYGLATLVGFSRLTSSAHFSSDVFAGAALGYSISRFVVLNPGQ